MNLFLEQIKNAKIVMKNKRFWQIQGLNVISFCIPLLIRLGLLSLYVTVANLILYGSSDKFSTRQLNYLIGGFLLIGLGLIIFNCIKKFSNVKNTDFIFKVFMILMQIVIEYGVLLLLFMFGARPQNPMDNFIFVSNMVFYSILASFVLLLLFKLSIAMVTKHFNDGEEKNQWKNWTVIESIQSTKRYEELFPTDPENYKSEWQEVVSEKQTIRFLYSKLTLSEEKIVSDGSKFKLSNHPDKIFENMKIINRGTKNGHTNRIS